MHRISRIVGREVLPICSAAVVLGLCAGAARANLLVDAGFETPSANPTDVLLPTSQTGAAANPTFPWYDLLSTSGDQAEISSDVPTFSGGPTPPPANRINSGTGKTGGSSGGGGNSANTGDQYDYAFTVGQPSGTVGGVAQLITGINPGDLYAGSAYFFVKANNSTDGDRFQAGGSNDSLKMIFEDSLGNQIGSTVLSTLGADAGKVDSTSPQNTWIQVSTLPTAAPVGATQVLFEMALTRGASGGVQFGDDADLEDVVPEPASLGMLIACSLLPRRRLDQRCGS